jgi:fatty acid amide hydrolase
MLQRIEKKEAALTDLSASELAAGIREGRFSSEEVVEAHIQRIEAVNDELNAVVIPLFEQARHDAKKADAALRDGIEPGPLHGVPMTIKEQFMLAGTDTTIGLRAYASQPYAADGPLVARLRQAGAIFLGKTNVPQLLSSLETNSALYGRCNNPYDHRRTPGGSSGGEAAIIAAHGSPLGLGADFGGSTRVPAHFCGLYGLKPTSSRLTAEDTPGQFFIPQNAIMPQPGPLARTVADVRLAMNVLVNPSPHISMHNIPPVPWHDPERIAVSGLRVGYYTDNGVFSASPAIRRAVMEAVAGLESLGVTAVPFTPPDMAEGSRLFLGITSADGGETMRRALAGEKPGKVIQQQLLGAEMPNRLRPLIARFMKAQGQKYLADQVLNMGKLSAIQYMRLVERQTMYRMQWLEAMAAAELDAILCPPFALPALTHDTFSELVPAATYTFPFNVLGFPAGVVPITTVQPGEESDRVVSRDRVDITAQVVEHGSAGLPVGVQVVAPHWREDIVLAIMAALESVHES